MLVLRRSCGQSFVIGKNAEIIVKILSEENGVVSVGIAAPKSIAVDRLEVYEKRQLNLKDSVHLECMNTD
jgi:carbon storage regulator CsrA